MEEIKKIMSTNLAGEIKDRSKINEFLIVLSSNGRLPNPVAAITIP